MLLIVPQGFADLAPLFCTRGFYSIAESTAPATREPKSTRDPKKKGGKFGPENPSENIDAELNKKFPPKKP